MNVAIPALLTRTSTPPASSSTTDAEADYTPAASETSHVAAVARAPLASRPPMRPHSLAVHVGDPRKARPAAGVDGDLLSEPPPAPVTHDTAARERQERLLPRSAERQIAFSA